VSDDGGWIKLHRSLAKHPLWLKEPFTIGQAWADLLMLANYHDSTVFVGHKVMTIHRGQVFTSLERLGTRWRRDRKTVRRWLGAYGSDGMLDRATAYGADGGYTLLTIRNYDAYQGQPASQWDGGEDRGADGALDGGRDRAGDRGRDRGRAQSEEVEEVKDAEEAKKGAHSFSSNGTRGRASRKNPDRDWGRGQEATP
jgi:hypothetical protein